MAKYPRARRRPLMRICPKLLMMAMAFTLLAVVNLSAAQANGRTDQKTGEARLHITALVVPAVLLPPPQARQAQGAVTYNMPSRQITLSVTQALRPLPGTFYKDAVLKTVTVVPQ